MLPTFPCHDVAVLGGVLEYVNDVGALLRQLHESVNIIVASYAVREEVQRLLERRSHGWVNDFTSGELEEIFARSGFDRDRAESWRGQRIYRFVINRAAPLGISDESCSASTTDLEA
jgi:hypothetical protein